jgi:geranylgeranyl diphosphate synthase type II
LELAVSIEKYKTLLEDKLDELKIPSTPADLYDPIRYILSLGGKRMRPVLLLMATEMFDGDIDEAINQALAVEVFHNFTLVHDDIMDKAPVRRGYPTVHTKWNENVGILSGDVMFVLAYKLISTNRTPKLHKILDVFNTTAIEVCEGQQLDMDYETQENVSIEDYIEMIRLKTAVLLGGTLKIGAVIAETSEENAHNIYEFGHKLGIAFQLQDDLLDVFGNPEKFGKQVG